MNSRTYTPPQDQAGHRLARHTCNRFLKRWLDVFKLCITTIRLQLSEQSHKIYKTKHSSTENQEFQELYYYLIWFFPKKCGRKNPHKASSEGLNHVDLAWHWTKITESSNEAIGIPIRVSIIPRHWSKQKQFYCVRSTDKSALLYLETWAWVVFRQSKFIPFIKRWFKYFGYFLAFCT